MSGAVLISSISSYNLQSSPFLTQSGSAENEEHERDTKANKDS